jgi:hypothetical protein
MSTSEPVESSLGKVPQPLGWASVAEFTARTNVFENPTWVARYKEAQVRQFAQSKFIVIPRD